MNERNLLRTLIDNIPDAIFAKDIKGRFILKNLADARRMGAASTEETIGKTDFDYYSPELAAQYDADDQKVIQSGEAVIDREEQIIGPTGYSGWVLTTKLPLQDHEGKVIGLVGIGHDITERKRAEAKNRQHIEHLMALSEIDRAISGSFDLKFVLFKLLAHVTGQLAVDATDILLLEPSSDMLAYAVGVGFRTSEFEHARLRVGQGYAGTAALEQQTVQAFDLLTRKTGFLRSSGFKAEEFDSYIGLPLIVKGKVLGVLEVFQRGPLRPDQEWLDFLHTLAGQAAIAIDNAAMFEGLERSNTRLAMAYNATLEGWSRALDLRDKDTEGHTQRVTTLCVRLARNYGLPGEELENIRRGALLHDIGKMGVPDSILLKPGPLTDEEWVLMKRHPAIAHDLISPIEFLRPAIDIPYCHHEKWDGSGYPRGLKGEEIPIAARIFSVVDVWDALTSDRPYRAAWPGDKALAYIQEQSGKQFDPKVVSAFLTQGMG